MPDKDNVMVKYGVAEEELEIEKTAGRTTTTPPQVEKVETTDKRVKVPWLKKTEDKQEG